jgi:hypothetical protein
LRAEIRHDIIRPARRQVDIVGNPRALRFRHGTYLPCSAPSIMTNSGRFGEHCRANVPTC